MKQVRSKVWNPTWVIEKKSIEKLNSKDDGGNGQSVFSGSIYENVGQHRSSVQENIYIDIPD